jgi:hypothetical protein
MVRVDNAIDPFIGPRPDFPPLPPRLVDRAVYCTPSYVSMEVGMSWVLLRKPAAAMLVFEQSLSS